MKFNTLNATYGNMRKSFCGRPRDLRKFTCGEPPAGSSQLHSMTLAALHDLSCTRPRELRLRPKLTEGHRMMTAPVNCRRLGLGWAAVSCTLRPWLQPAGVSFSWRGQLSRAGNKHSSGQCVKVIFNFLL